VLNARFVEVFFSPEFVENLESILCIVFVLIFLKILLQVNIVIE